MKKRIILLVLLSFLITGTVAASSINGDYKGDPVVKVTSNGKELTVTDVPAYLRDNRTMVPLYLLKQLGVQLTWDLESYSVDVKLPETTVTSDTYGSVSDTKKYVFLADYYHQLDRLGEILIGTSNNLEIVYNHFKLGTDPGHDFDWFNKTFDSDINSYNSVLGTYKAIEKYSNTEEDAKINTILKSYYDAIDKYKESLKGLQSYVNNRTTQNFNSYFTNASDGSNLAYDGRQKAYGNFTEFIYQAEK